VTSVLIASSYGAIDSASMQKIYPLSLTIEPILCNFHDCPLCVPENEQYTIYCSYSNGSWDRIYGRLRVFVATVLNQLGQPLPNVSISWHLENDSQYFWLIGYDPFTDSFGKSTAGIQAEIYIHPTPVDVYLNVTTSFISNTTRLIHSYDGV
jgi:hypothetical protein